MHRFFVLRTVRGDASPRGAPETESPPISPAPWTVGEELELSPSDAAHAARVLRLRPGQTVVVSDGRGYDYDAVLVHVSAQAARVRIASVQRSPAEPDLFLTLVQGIAKGSKMDFIVQKAVEVGVGRIIPVETERTVVRLDRGKADARVERWRRIAYEAAKQAGRGRVPWVEEVHSWADVWERDDLGFAVVPWEAEDGRRLLDVVKAFPEAGEGGAPSRLSITAAIGPEGGLSAAEVALAKRRGAHPVTMGPRILRTETAAIVAASLILAVFGELG